MKEIVIASGKGGAGKTCFTAVLCALAGRSAVYVDADVDAANLEILLDSKENERYKFHSGKTAEIIQGKCTSCGLCEGICQFDAINHVSDKYMIDELSCEGCGACLDVCDFNAIELKENYCGDWFVSDTKFGGKLVHARLGAAEDNSGKLVAEIKNVARKIAQESGVDYILVDGPPGIGCPTISSLSGADLLVTVSEAGVSGIHDSSRLLGLASQFNINSVCIMNKTGLNIEAEGNFEGFLKEKNIPVIGNIPFNEKFMALLNNKQTWLETSDRELKEHLISIWDSIKSVVQ